MKAIIVMYVALVLFCLGGYTSNIVRLCRCDFQQPYRAECVRTIGVFFPPVGVVAGYLSIQDGG